MKYLILALTVSLCSFSSCNKKEMSSCIYGGGIFKGGYSFAKGSYEDFGDNAIFVRHRLSDSITGLWIHDEINKGFLLTTLTEQCSEKAQIGIKNIRLVEQDTLYISFSPLGTGRDFPTASFHISDDDASIERYDLLQGDSLSNWFVIESINADSTEVSGTFQLSFVTSYEPYLTGERERWDDPNRPDTLHFTNGEFRAVFSDF